MSNMYVSLIIGLSFLLSCSKTENDINKLAGTWIEKEPELYDGITDTIVFTKNLQVEKHFYFNDYNYEQKNDSISFYSSNKNFSYSFKFITNDEIVIYNFLDRVITAEIKNIQFIREY